jgi:hypothetical protein
VAKRRPAAILIVCALALLAAACGGDEEMKGPAAATQTPETPTLAGLQDPAESAAAAIGSSGAFATVEEAIAAFAGTWRGPFLGDCDALAEPQPGSCLAAAREVGLSHATYRPCVPGTDACLIVTFERRPGRRWTLSGVESGGPGPAQQLVP